MIQFNELQLDTATDTLIVDVAVKTLSYYSNVYIKAIHITTEEYSENSPNSSKKNIAEV